MLFKHNPKIEYMTVTDRILWLLQHFGVSMTQNEFIGLRLTDGMYEEDLKQVLLCEDINQRDNLGQIWKNLYLTSNDLDMLDSDHSC